jgi:hypothetical protein
VSLVRAVCFDLLSALLDSWAVREEVGPGLGRAMAQGFQVTWVNRLGHARPDGLEGAEMVPSLTGWTPR